MKILNNVQNDSLKTLSESQTVNKLLALSRQMGCEHEFKTIYNRYCGLLKSCSEQERESIQLMGAIEVHKLFGFANPLIVNGKEILPGEPGWEQKMPSLNKNIIKLDR